jgi:broad-specificity NMP kinase
LERAVFDTAAPRITSFEVREVDRSLPEWARRSNPIVRRHLGEYWKTMSLDLLLVLRIFIGNSVFVLLSLPLPFLLTHW